jgi:glycosyltransferase involved in cell wall biosynthesis
MKNPLINDPSANTPNRRTGICLNMIVKNETKVLDRLFRSVKDVIDYYVIVDTGSTDATPEFITRWMRTAGIPGEVHHREWVNFGVNRDQALKLACAADCCDWVLFIDADEELGFSNPFFYQDLEQGTSYYIEKHHDQIRYAVLHLLDIRRNTWEWRGPAHEYIAHLSGPNARDRLDDLWIIFHTGQGARSHGVTQKEKFLRDARLFEAEVARQPDDARSRFYLAQSYRDAGERRKAYQHYGKRVGMGGWAEEAYVAQCERAKLAISLGLGHTDIVAEHLKAYSLRPTRAEALGQLAAYCREHRRYPEGYLFSKVGKDIPLPPDILFVRRDIYEWRLLDEFSICAYWIGHYGEAVEAGQQLLAEGRYPPSEKERLARNLQFAQDKL